MFLFQSLKKVKHPKYDMFCFLGEVGASCLVVKTLTKAVKHQAYSETELNQFGLSETESWKIGE